MLVYRIQIPVKTQLVSSASHTIHPFSNWTSPPKTISYLQSEVVSLDILTCLESKRHKFVTRTSQHYKPRPLHACWARLPCRKRSHKWRWSRRATPSHLRKVSRPASRCTRSPHLHTHVHTHTLATHAHDCSCQQ